MVFGRWLFHLNGIVRDGRELQIRKDLTTIGMRIRSHASLSMWCQFRQLRSQMTILIKKFLRMIATHPLFQNTEMFRLISYIGYRDLMRAKCVFNRQTIDFLRASPAFGGTQDNHRPLWSFQHTLLPRIFLTSTDMSITVLQCPRKVLMYLSRATPTHKV